MNAQEIFNEGCILAVTYPSLLFTGYFNDPELEYKAGWYIIAVIGFNLIINMTIAIS